jgi:hypothetical protein
MYVPNYLLTFTEQSFRSWASTIVNKSGFTPGPSPPQVSAQDHLASLEAEAVADAVGSSYKKGTKTRCGRATGLLVLDSEVCDAVEVVARPHRRGTGGFTTEQGNTGGRTQKGRTSTRSRLTPVRKGSKPHVSRDARLLSEAAKEAEQRKAWNTRRQMEVLGDESPDSPAASALAEEIYEQYYMDIYSS